MKSLNRWLGILFAGALVFLVACAPLKSTVQPPIKKELAPGAECAANDDCAPAQCCHATGCVPKAQAPNCSGAFCTEECKPGTIDCGGGCVCKNQKCEAQLTYEPGERVIIGEKETPESCSANGGDWQASMAGMFCNQRTNDSGKPCTDSDQCEGACLGDKTGKGACSPHQAVFSCVILIENGTPSPICID